MIHGIAVVKPSTLVAFKMTRPDFTCSQRCGCVSGKIGMTGAGDKDDDAILFEVSNRPAQNKGFGNIFAFRSRSDAGDDTALLELTLQGETLITVASIPM